MKIGRTFLLLLTLIQTSAVGLLTNGPGAEPLLGPTASTTLVQNTNAAANLQRWRFGFETHFPKKGLAGNIASSKGSQFNGDWAYNDATEI